MFFKLVARNSRRSRKENLLFMSSLIISVIAFYMVLSLENQDVVRYLRGLESDAVQKLLALTSALYMFTLAILFFLVYYASRYQIGRRSHELGVYLMMGMRRSKLLGMLLVEDLTSTFLSLVIGIPVALFLTEIISLLTGKLVGIGYIGHKSTFSIGACIFTAIGFFAIKLLSFIIISFKIACQDVGTMLQDAPENIKPPKRSALYLVSLVIGLIFLIVAFTVAILGISWLDNLFMLMTMFFGLVGIFAFFWGLRYVVDKLVSKSKAKKLSAFNMRQTQDSVTYRSGTLAICSVLMLAAIVCLGSGVATFGAYDMFQNHYTDYTFTFDDCSEGDDPEVVATLDKLGVLDRFKHINEMRIGYVRCLDDIDDHDAFYSEQLFFEMDRLYPGTYMDTFPHIIKLGDYNDLLETVGLPKLELEDGEIGVYCDPDMMTGTEDELNKILASKPACEIAGDEWTLGGKVQTVPVVTDYMLSLSIAYIIPDEAFEKYSAGRYTTYYNGFLDESKFETESFLREFELINEKLDTTELQYDCYLTNMGRQLFYLVAASYCTLYLAIDFWMIANTILGVQFLMGQKKTSFRFRTLIKLGADYKTLCDSANTQIMRFFGIPLCVAMFCSVFGIRAMFEGILSSRAKVNITDMMISGLIAIFVLILIECVYVFIVRRSSSKYLKSLMVLDREE